MLCRILVLLLMVISMPAESATASVVPDSVPYGRAARVMVEGLASPGSQYLLTPGGPFLKQTLPPDPAVRGATAREGAALWAGAVAVAVQGDVTLVARGGGLTVFDTADPSHPKWLGSHGRLGNVAGVRMRGQRAVVWNDCAEVILLDIARPSLPSVIAIWRGTENAVDAWFGEGEDDVMVAMPSKVQVIDFSAMPPHFSNQNLDVGQGVNFGGERRLFIRDDIAYVADWFSGVHLYDIRDPRRPRLLSTYHTPGSAKGVWVAGDYAFVADDDWGLQVLNVKDPVRPMPVASLATNGLAYTPKLVGNVLYLASHRGGFQLIDVSRPAFPQIIVDVDTPGKAWSLDVAGNTLFVADDSSGILVFDVSEPRQPRQIGAFTPGGAAEDVVVRGNVAYAAFFDQGFYVLDISNPAQPKPLGHVATPGNARAIALQGDLAYVTDWFAGVQVIDVTDPTHPAIIGSYDTSGAAWGIGLKGDHAYIGDWWGGFAVLDISAPKRPALAGHYHARGQVTQVAAQGKFAFTANGANGMQVFDISNPLNPTWATGVDVEGTVRSIWLDGSLAYLAVDGGADEGLMRVDVRNPYQPHVVDKVKISGGALNARTHEGRAYVMTSRGLVVVDGVDPAQTRPLAAYKVNDVWGDNGRVFLATDHGLAMFDTRHKEKLHHKSTTEALLVRARGNEVFVHERGAGIRILDIAGGDFRQTGLFATDEPLSDLRLEGEILYATARDSGLLAINIADPAQPVIQAIYPLVQPATRIEISSGAALLGGGDIITSVRLLPPVAQTSAGDGKIQLEIPKDLPLGSYDLVRLRPDGGREVSRNALKIEMPRFSKPKITPEEFQRLLREQRKLRESGK
ncbi:MAG: hypothetical protein IDH49_09260 [Gammaproteobacteria bacterium]|nr:hypothetical protein [Gammaproteobacteria bacterium]